MARQTQQKNTTSLMQPARPAPKHSRRALSEPEMVHIDVLATMTDDELAQRQRSLEIDRQEAESRDLETRLWEEELAYCRREAQLRRSRREAHEKYEKQLEQEFFESEANLPVADLDNSKFLKSIGMWYN